MKNLKKKKKHILSNLMQLSLEDIMRKKNKKEIKKTIRFSHSFGPVTFSLLAKVSQLQVSQ